MPAKKEALRRRVRGKKGALSKLCDAPVEVALEIFGHLEPRDLLTLARVDKAISELILKTTSAWELARANVADLPPRPEFLTEQAYAHLMFANFCHVCARPHITTILFCWNVRYCRTCRELKTSKIYTYQTLINEIVKDTRVRDTFYVWGDEVHIPEVEKFREEWNKLGDDLEGRKRLAEASAANVAMRAQHVRRCLVWKSYNNATQRARIQSLKEARLAAIKERLRKTQYADDLRHIPDWQLSKQPFAKKTGAITDRVWDNMSAEVIYFMETKRMERIRAERKRILRPRAELVGKILEEWTAEMKAEEYKPSDDEALKRVLLPDFLLMPEISIIVNPSAGGSMVIAQLFLPLGGKLVDLVNRWHDARRQDLNAMLEEVLPYIPDPEDAQPAELAVAAFDCVDPKCHARFMHYPDVLGHRCRGSWRVEADAYSCDSSYRSVVQELMADKSSDAAWQAEHVRVNTQILAGKQREIVRVCFPDSDPDTVLARDLDRRGKRLTCGDCVGKGLDEEFGFEVFDWRRALHHQASMRHGADAEPCQWVVLPEEVAAKVREFEDRTKAGVATPRYLQYDTWACLCKAKCISVAGYDDIVTHVRSQHDIQGEPKPDVHYKAQMEYPTYSVPGWLLYKTFMRHTKSGEVEVYLKDDGRDPRKRNGEETTSSGSGAREAHKDDEDA